MSTELDHWPIARLVVLFCGGAMFFCELWVAIEPT